MTRARRVYRTIGWGLAGALTATVSLGIGTPSSADDATSVSPAAAVTPLAAVATSPTTSAASGTPAVTPTDSPSASPAPGASASPSAGDDASKTADGGPEAALSAKPAPTETPTTASSATTPPPTADNVDPIPSGPTAPATDSGSFVSAPAAVVPGSLVDVTINVSGPANGVAGAEYTYVALVGNNSLPDADGATFVITTPGGSTGVVATCTASGDATCPAALTTTNAQVKGTAGLLPHNGRLTITITGRYAAPSPSSVTSVGTVTAPAGTTDYDTTSNKSTVATTVSNQTGVVVAQTQTATSMSPGSPNTYTLTWTNNGPADAAGTVTLAMMYFRTEVYSSATITGFSCTATGGLVCPSTSAASVGGSYGVVFSQTQATFPAGATMTVTYTADLVPASPQGCGYATVAVGADVRATVPTGFANVGLADLFIYSNAPGTPACPTTDLTVTKSQSATTIAAGSPVTYTVAYRNIGPGAADGASLMDAMYYASPVQSLAVHFVSCTTTGGATCPALTDKALTVTGAYAVQTTAPRFPAGSTIQISYTVEATIAATPPCSSSGSSSVENRASIAVPAGVVEVGSAPNQASVFATAPSAPVCPRAALSVTKTVDKTTLFPGDPTTYTVTYTNRGPDAADGAWIADYLELYPARFITSAQVTIVSCVGTGGASCPSFVTSKSVSNSSYLWSGPVGSFPNGATLTIVASVDPIAGGTSCTSGTATVPNTATITLPSGMFGSNGTSGAVNVTAACADIAVNKSIDRTSVQPGDPVTYSVRVSNASVGAAKSVQVTDPLPRGFIFGSASCTPSSGTSTCATPTYDSTTRTVSAVIPVVGPNQGYVTIAIAGTAGAVGGTYSNTATAGSLTTGADRFIDPVPTSNSSTAVLTIYGTASKVTVTKRLTGLPAGGVPVALTFSGTITCDVEGSKPWSATVPAGASSATASPVPFFDGQQCTVTEGPAPTLPAGFNWVGAADVEPASLAVTGPSSTYDVTVTNRLTPNAALTLAKTVSRGEATVGDQITYTYQISNGGPIAVSAPVIHETVFSGSGPLPAPSCPAGAIAPGESIECSTVYTITPADVATGLLTNVAYATATPVAGPEPRTPPATASVRLVAPPALTLTKHATPATYAAVGDEISYTYDVRNTGGVPLTSLTITETESDGSGDAPQPQCPASAATLGVGEQTTCTATYRVTQADLDRGSVANTAVATGSAPQGFANPETTPATVTVSAVQRPSIALTKSVFPVSQVAFVPGTTLTYSFVVTNTGNVTLTGVRVDDAGAGGTFFGGTGELSAITCDAQALAPGDQTTCTATYQITDADLGAGSLTNTAIATGLPPAGPPVTSAAETAVVPDAAAPAVGLAKSATPEIVHREGDTIHFTYELTNSGNVPLIDPVVNETVFTGAGPTPEPTCPVGAWLPGETLICTADYIVEAADLRGSTIGNTATATGTAPDGSQVTSASATASVEVVPGIPGISLVKSASPETITAAGQRISYTFEVTNTGETPLADIAVTETDFSGTGPAPRLSCPSDGQLAVGGVLTCTATYTVTQADVDAGSVVNTATASGRMVPDVADSAPVVATDSVDVPVEARPALELRKSVSPASVDTFVVGQRVTYTFVATNTGNVTLRAGTVLEGEFTGSGTLAPVVCDGWGPLAPGQQVVCAAEYTLTSADVEAGRVSNTAQAVANPPIGDPAHSLEASADLPVAPTPGLVLVKSVSPGVVHQAGDLVTFSFAVTNTGDVTVRAVAIAETSFTGAGRLAKPSCPLTTLEPGQAMTCTAQYVVTSIDVQRGAIDNTASATASFGSSAARGTPSGSNSLVGAASLDPGSVTSAPSSAHVGIDSSPAPPSDGGVASGGSTSTGGGLVTTGAQSAGLVAMALALLAAGASLAWRARRVRSRR